jgi:hypothetical protein
MTKQEYLFELSVPRQVKPGIVGPQALRDQRNRVLYTFSVGTATNFCFRQHRGLRLPRLNQRRGRLEHAANAEFAAFGARTLSR